MVAHVQFLHLKTVAEVPYVQGQFELQSETASENKQNLKICMETVWIYCI